MEVVVIADRHIVAKKVSTHNALGVLNVPWSTMEACHILGVDQKVVVAGLLCLIITLQDKGVN